MYQGKKLLSIIFLTLFLLITPKINAKTCCTRHVTVAISGSAVEANLAMAMWLSLFASNGEGSLSQCPILIVGPGGCLDYHFKGVLFSGPVGRLDMKLIDCVHNKVVKEASITWPCVSFPNSCIDIMMNFITLFAGYFQPLDKIIFDYERIPEHCEIEVEKEEVSPGQEIQVKLSDITNAEGRKSREFNRILVSASTGEIIGGTELDSDPKFKAFRVENGAIAFNYKASDTEDNPGNTDDAIYVYNSCDILPENLSPMSSTELRDKIAEKKIKITSQDLIAEYTSTYEEEMNEPEKNAKEKNTYSCKIKAAYHLRYSSKEDGTIEEGYDIISSKLENVSGHGKTSAHYVDNLGDEHIVNGASTVPSGTIDHSGTGLEITYDAVTGRVKKIEIDFFSVYFNIEGTVNETTKYRNGNIGHETSPAAYVPALVEAVVSYPEFVKASGSRDGGVISGGGTHIIPESEGVRFKLSVHYTFRKIKH